MSHLYRIVIHSTDSTDIHTDQLWTVDEMLHHLVDIGRFDSSVVQHVRVQQCQQYLARAHYLLWTHPIRVIIPRVVIATLPMKEGWIDLSMPTREREEELWVRTDTLRMPETTSPFIEIRDDLSFDWLCFFARWMSPHHVGHISLDRWDRAQARQQDILTFSEWVDLFPDLVDDVHYRLYDDSFPHARPWLEMALSIVYFQTTRPTEEHRMRCSSVGEWRTSFVTAMNDLLERQRIAAFDEKYISTEEEEESEEEESEEEEDS